MSKNIILIGFMGAGKSLVARELAKRLQRPLVSTDAVIEKKTGQKITEIFQRSGEKTFRDLEKQAVAQIVRQEGQVIDCGGGVVLSPENLSSLKKSGVVFYLRARAAVIYERIKNEKHRPLLNNPDPLATITELLAQREAVYQEADHVIDANDPSIEPVCLEIITIMGKLPGASR